MEKVMTKPAAFYSRKPGEGSAIKRHRQRSAALAAAGEMGQIWDTENAVQRQVNKNARGDWMTSKPDSFLASDLEGELRTLGYI